MLNIDSLGFIKNERNAQVMLLEQCLISSQVDSDFSMKTLCLHLMLRSAKRMIFFTKACART